MIPTTHQKTFGRVFEILLALNLLVLLLAGSPEFSAMNFLEAPLNVFIGAAIAVWALINLANIYALVLRNERMTFWQITVAGVAFITFILIILVWHEIHVLPF